MTEKLYEQEELRCRSGSGAVEAEKVGDYRVQYRKAEHTELSAELAALAEMYLFGTGLLYRGIPVAAW